MPLWYLSSKIIESISPKSKVLNYFPNTGQKEKEKLMKKFKLSYNDCLPSVMLPSIISKSDGVTFHASDALCYGLSRVFGGADNDDVAMSNSVDTGGDPLH